MKKQLAAFCLVAVSVGICQLPALADFGRYDYNHDGHWNHHEFYNANVYYGHHHHEAVMERRAYDRDFGRLDRNHDGYLDRHEVNNYHHWD